MRHKEGLSLSTLDESMLDSSGILKSNADSPITYGLTEEAVRLFLLIAAAGEAGLPKSRVPKELSADLSTHLLPLDLQSLVAWERDNRGRLAYLVLTWKGEEALKSARASASRPASWAARRKAAVSN